MYEQNRENEPNQVNGRIHEEAQAAQADLLAFVREVQEQMNGEGACSPQELESWVALYNHRYRSWRALCEQSGACLDVSPDVPQTLEEAERVRTFLDRYSVERQNTHCRKWDGVGTEYSRPDLLPLWVADMDFAPPEPLEQVVSQRMHHQALGYALRPDSYIEAMQLWLQKHAGYTPPREWLVSVPSVGTGLAWAIQTWTREGDGILSFLPGYPFFRKAIEDNRRIFIPSTLRYDGGNWFLDREDLDRQVHQSRVNGTPVRALILCSPHNPSGRIWRSEELLELLSWCAEQEILLLADEIHQDLTLTNQVFRSVLSVCPEEMQAGVAVFHSLSKTFGLAGIPQANLLVPDAGRRAALESWMERVYPAKPHALNWTLLEAAYRTGGPWLADCKCVLRANAEWAKRWQEENLPLARSSTPEAGFLWFLDLGAYIPASSLHWVMEELCQVAISYGEAFGGAEYETWVRINLATHPDRLQTALRRIHQVIQQLSQFRGVVQ